MRVGRARAKCCSDSNTIDQAIRLIIPAPSWSRLSDMPRPPSPTEPPSPVSADPIAIRLLSRSILRPHPTLAAAPCHWPAREPARPGRSGAHAARDASAPGAMTRIPPPPPLAPPAPDLSPLRAAPNRAGEPRHGRLQNECRAHVRCASARRRRVAASPPAQPRPTRACPIRPQPRLRDARRRPRARHGWVQKG